MGDGAINRVCLMAVICAAMMVAAAQSAYAGAWTLPKGDAQLISTYTYSNAERAFDGDRNAGARVDFVKSEQSLYGEYGLSDKLTLVGSSAIQDISYIARDGPQSFSGFGISRLGLRYKLPDAGQWVRSVQGGLVVPAGGESVPDADLGQGGLGADLRLMAGRNLTVFGRPAFFDAQAYLDYRSGDAPQQLGMDFTIGVDIHPRWQLIGQSFAHYTTSGTFERDEVLENDGLRLQGSLVYRFGKDRKQALQLGVFDTIIGRNTVRQSGLSIGVWQAF